MMASNFNDHSNVTQSMKQMLGTGMMTNGNATSHKKFLS